MLSLVNRPKFIAAIQLTFYAAVIAIALVLTFFIPSAKEPVKHLRSCSFSDKLIFSLAEDQC